jgi:hypothetical protein
MLPEAQFNEEILILDGCRVDIENNMNMRWSDFVVNRAYIKQCDMCEWSDEVLIRCKRVKEQPQALPTRGSPVFAFFHLTKSSMTVGHACSVLRLQR